jgi:hypothetical protein
MGKPPQIRPGVRVVPRDERLRSVLVHPIAGKFRPSGSIEWPDDKYTRRRLAAGHIKIVTREPAKAAEPAKTEWLGDDV